MKNILNNKIIPILLITLIVIFNITSNVFASITFTSNGVDYSYTDPPEEMYNQIMSYQYVVLGYSSNKPVYFCSNTEILYDVEFTADRFKYDDYDNQWHFDNGTFRTLKFMNETWGDTDYFPLYTNYNLKDSQGNTVFPVAPQTPEITRVLVEQGTRAEMGETILATIKTFLIYLLIFVISMIAIWKAVRFLRNALKTS